MVRKKQEMEKYFFERFSKLYFEHKIDFKQPNPPEPDIKFNYNNKRIGLEITVIQSDADPSESSKKCASENNYLHLCKQLEKKLKTNTQKDFLIKIHFNYDQPLTKKRVDELISLIEFPVLKIIQIETSDTCLFSHDINLDITEFNKILIDFSHIKGQFVNSSIATFPPFLETEKIENIIESKSRKHLTNLFHFDKLWLLLIVENEMLSSEFLIDKQRIKLSASELWDKIFLLRLRADKIIELN